MTPGRRPMPPRCCGDRTRPPCRRPRSRSSARGSGSTAGSTSTAPTRRRCTTGRSATSTGSGRPSRSTLGVRFHDAPTATLGSREMPGAEWFPGATLNYAEHALTPGPGRADDDVARSSSPARTGWSARSPTPSCATRSAARRAGLVRAGVGRGDRVVALAPNCVETLVAFLAAASLGAIWSSCSPDFGARAVHDRFAQIEPVGAGRGRRLPLRRQGVRHPARPSPRCRASCPRCGTTVLVPYLDPAATLRRTPCRGRSSPATPAPLEFEPVPFDHPLWVLYSSGHHRPAEGHRARARRHRRSSTSRRCACSRTSGRATGSSGSPPPAG